MITLLICIGFMALIMIIAGIMQQLSSPECRHEWVNRDKVGVDTPLKLHRRCKWCNEVEA